VRDIPGGAEKSNKIIPRSEIIAMKRQLKMKNTDATGDPTP
jgi:hypothetical protein